MSSVLLAMDSPDSPHYINVHGCLKYVKEHTNQNDPQSILEAIEILIIYISSLEIYQ